VQVKIPTPLRSYTAGASFVDATGTTIDELLRDIDAQCPGLRFRIVDEQGQLRRHMKVFVNQESVRDLSTAVAPDDDVVLMQALSGG
jgi:sulfur-carrier protein